MMLKFQKMQIGLRAKEPLVGMPTMALCSSTRLLHLPKFLNSLISLNFMRKKKTFRVTQLKARYLGNLGCKTICMSLDRKKMSARLSQMNKVLQDVEECAASVNEPIPRVSLEHVMVNFARSGGPGGKNVNKVNTKVDMRFNVVAADWLSTRIRERILQMVCHYSYQ